MHVPGINPNCEGSMTDNITGFRSISITKPSATLDRVDVKEMGLRSLLMSSIVETLAKRLEKVLAEIIHSNQNAFVKGRSIFDAIRTIDDMMGYTKEKELSGILVAIDFEKAFDTLNFNFLIRTLLLFGGFEHCIKIYRVA